LQVGGEAAAFLVLERRALSTKAHRPVRQRRHAASKRNRQEV